MTDAAWNPCDSVGVPALDAEHRDLCELAEALRLALLGGSPAAAVHGLLDDLLEQTLAHFEHEEEALARAGYPGLAAHRASHDRLLRTILHFRADVRHRRYEPAVAARFIMAWVMEHVRSEDSRYAPHLRAAGRGAGAVGDGGGG